MLDTPNSLHGFAVRNIVAGQNNCANRVID